MELAMDLSGAFAILEALIDACLSAMAVTAEIGRELAAIFWSTSVLFTLSVMIAGGASGVAAYIIRAVIWGGIVIGGLMLWPTVVEELWASLNELSVWISGSEFNPLATAERGFDLLKRTTDQAMSWNLLLPWNWPTAIMIIGAGVGIQAIFLFLSLVLAFGILQFFLMAGVAPLMIPFVLAGPLSGFGMTLVGGMLSSLVYLASLSVIITVGEAAFTEATIASHDEVLTFDDMWNVTLASLAVLLLAWRGSAWAANITRGASGGTGLTGIFGTLAGMALARGGGAAAGTAPAGQVAAGSSRAGLGAAGAGGRGAGGAPGGRAGTGVVGVQSRA
jgi:type IV secretory pathway TrbL component